MRLLNLVISFGLHAGRERVWHLSCLRQIFVTPPITRYCFGCCVSATESLWEVMSLQPGKACELPHKVFVFPLSTLACVCFVIGSLIGGRT